MWIWYVDQSQGGYVPAIVATAHRHHIGTVYIKSGDGTTYWEQFSGPLVAELHRGRAEGLRLAVRLRQQAGGRGADRGARRSKPAPTAW